MIATKRGHADIVDALCESGAAGVNLRHKVCKCTHFLGIAN